jgi:hypothetical protein
MRGLTVRVDGIAAEKIGSELVLMDLASEKVLSLNPVAAAIWDHLRAGVEPDSIVELVATRFAAAPDVIETDMTAFCDQLVDLGLATWQP